MGDTAYCQRQGLHAQPWPHHHLPTGDPHSRPSPQTGASCLAAGLGARPGPSPGSAPLVQGRACSVPGTWRENQSGAGAAALPSTGPQGHRRPGSVCVTGTCTGAQAHRHRHPRSTHKCVRGQAHAAPTRAQWGRCSAGSGGRTAPPGGHRRLRRGQGRAALAKESGERSMLVRRGEGKLGGRAYPHMRSHC